MEEPPVQRNTRDDIPLLRTATFKAAGPKPDPTEDLKTKIFGTINPGNQRISESLDYEPVQNKVFYARQKQAKEKRKFYGYTGHTLAKFIITLCTGVLTGIAALCLGKITAAMFEWKNGIVQGVLDEPGNHRVFAAFILHILYSCVLVSIGTAMVQYWAPSAAGAGVTLVMAYLNGNHVPNLLRLRTLITKFVGTVMSVSAGLPMGPEGPMVHIGACMASVITYIECKCVTTGQWLSCCGRRPRDLHLKEKLKVLDDIVSDADHREFVSAGTAAGISAAFGAPIGGVLFAMEEACTFWSRKTAWRCFLAAVFASYAMSELNSGATHGMIGFTGVNDLDNTDWLMQLPFILINASMAGLLGAAFNSLRMWLWRLRAAKTRHILRILEVCGLAILVCICGFFFSAVAGKCTPKSPDWGDTYGFRWQCEEGEHNDFATLFLSSGHETIIQLFSIGHNPGQAFVAHFTKGSLALYCFLYLVLMSIGAGTAIPGGLFMPSITLGGTWGALWGLIVRDWLPGWNVQPGLYALMAGTGTLGGVFRSTISLVVLVIEGTKGIEFLGGIILSVVVANWVAHHIHHDGVYESELERIGNVYMLRDEPPHTLHTQTAESIMATGVYGFKDIESVAKIMEALRTTTHNGFPVYGTDAGGAAGSETVEEGGRLEGLILRSQMLVLLQRRHFTDENGVPIAREACDKIEVELETEMRTFYRRYFTHNRYVAATAAPLDALQLEITNANGERIDLSQLYLDLRPYMNRSPFTIRKDCSASRTHQAFVQLGLRHLIVVDSHNIVVGIITRKDLDHAAGHGWWRVSAMAPKPKNNVLNKMFNNDFFRKIPSVPFFKHLVATASEPQHDSQISAARGDHHGVHSAAEEGRNHHHGGGSSGAVHEQTPLNFLQSGYSGRHNGEM